jgi:hypothetical protein
MRLCTGQTRKELHRPRKIKLGDVVEQDENDVGGIVSHSQSPDIWKMAQAIGLM